MRCISTVSARCPQKKRQSYVGGLPMQGAMVCRGDTQQHRGPRRRRRATLPAELSCRRLDMQSSYPRQQMKEDRPSNCRVLGRMMQVGYLLFTDGTGGVLLSACLDRTKPTPSEIDPSFQFNFPPVPGLHHFQHRIRGILSCLIHLRQQRDSGTNTKAQTGARPRPQWPPILRLSGKSWTQPSSGLGISFDVRRLIVKP